MPINTGGGNSNGEPSSLLPHSRRTSFFFQTWSFHAQFVMSAASCLSASCVTPYLQKISDALSKPTKVNSNEHLNFKDIGQEGLTSLDLNTSFVQEASSAFYDPNWSLRRSFWLTHPKTSQPTCNKATSMLPVCFIKDNYISIAPLYFLAFKLEFQHWTKLLLPASGTLYSFLS